jgi:tRNA G18 (ribose-2'-O)-methylase SpoU
MTKREASRPADVRAVRAWKAQAFREVTMLIEFSKIRIKLIDRNHRLSRLDKPHPRRQFVFVLCGVKKAITMAHVFRLAEALGASVWFLGHHLSAEQREELGGYFARWRSVSRTHFKDFAAVAARMKEEGIQPIAIEVTSTAKPYLARGLARQRRLALLVGSEESGIDEEILKLVGDQVYVPMTGRSLPLGRNGPRCRGVSSRVRRVRTPCSRQFIAYPKEK